MSRQTTYEMIIDKDSVDLLKEISKMKNFNINFSSTSEVSPLFYAVKVHATKIVSFLTSERTRLTREYKDIKLNTLDDSGNSALHIAILNQDFEIVRSLLKGGINLKIKNLIIICVNPTK